MKFNFFFFISEVKYNVFHETALFLAIQKEQMEIINTLLSKQDIDINTNCILIHI